MLDAGQGSHRVHRAILFWIAALLVIELLVRLDAVRRDGPDAFWLAPPPPSKSMLPPPDPKLGYVLSPADDRSGGYGSDTARLRILCLGNSNMYGHYVGPTQTFPWMLARSLAESGVEARVVNAGVPGYTASQIRANLEYQFRRDTFQVVIFTEGRNDLHASAAGETLRSLAAPGPPRGWIARIGIVRLVDAAMERIIRTARDHGARVYALDLPSGLADDTGMAEACSAEKVVYPPIRRFTPAGYRRLFRALLARYRTTLSEEGVPLLKSGLEFEVPWEEKKFLILDQCHPGPKGNARITSIVMARLAADGVLRRSRS